VIALGFIPIGRGCDSEAITVGMNVEWLGSGTRQNPLIRPALWFVCFEGIADPGRTGPSSSPLIVYTRLLSVEYNLGPMTTRTFCYAAVLYLGAVIAVVNAQAQSPSSSEAHLTAAKNAARFDWIGILARNCLEPKVGPAIGNYSTDPGRSIWYAEPEKVFDNLYFLGTKFHSAWALTTSAGIIVIDTLYNYASEPEIVDGMKKLGLDPAQIKYVLITHGHGDHDEGARLLQDRYGARVALGEGDWELIERARTFPGGKPKKDMTVKDAQKIVLGDTTLTVVTTPGHTPGSYGLLFSAKDHGRPVSVAYASGTAYTAYDKAFFDNFITSQRKMAAAAAAAKATVVISNHSAFDDAWTKARLAAWRPAGQPNPFEVGTDAVANYFKVMEECALAAEAALPQ
jgi:metallo-beta-lactamase class B